MAPLPKPLPLELEYQWFDYLQLEAMHIEDTQFEYMHREQNPEYESCRFLCAVKEHEIIGIAKIFMENNLPDMQVSFIEVAKNFRHRGIGNLLIEKIYDYAKDHAKAVTFDGFTPDGRNYLLRAIERSRASEKKAGGFIPYC